MYLILALVIFAVFSLIFSLLISALLLLIFHFLFAFYSSLDQPWSSSSDSDRSSCTRSNAVDHCSTRSASASTLEECECAFTSNTSHSRLVSSGSGSYNGRPY